MNPCVDVIVKQTYRNSGPSGEEATDDDDIVSGD